MSLFSLRRDDAIPSTRAYGQRLKYPLTAACGSDFVTPSPVAAAPGSDKTADRSRSQSDRSPSKFYLLSRWSLCARSARPAQEICFTWNNVCAKTWHNPVVPVSLRPGACPGRVPSISAFLRFCV